MDINVTGVWEYNVTGQGVTVVVIDDGVEHTHPDIQSNYVSLKKKKKNILIKTFLVECEVDVYIVKTRFDFLLCCLRCWLTLLYQSPEGSYDLNSNDPDPMPHPDSHSDNRHGTRCAGEIAAVPNNSVCAVGVAYGSKVAGSVQAKGFYVLEGDTKCMWWDLCQLLFSVKVSDYWMDL